MGHYVTEETVAGYTVSGQVTPSSDMPITGKFGLGKIEMFPVPGTYTFTVPNGINSVRVRLWGAGGTFFTVSIPEGGQTYFGGNGGGFSLKSITDLTPGQQIPISVGKGGDSSAGILSGGSSSFGSYLSASGGGLALNAVGVGIGGDINYPGGRGGYGGATGGGGAGGLFGAGGMGGGSGSPATSGSSGGGGGNLSSGSGGSYGGQSGASGFTGLGGTPARANGGGGAGDPGTAGIDFIATGGGGASTPYGSSIGGGSGSNGGGGGAYGAGGFPGGAAGQSGTYGGNGLVIVEY